MSAVINEYGTTSSILTVSKSLLENQQRGYVLFSLETEWSIKNKNKIKYTKIRKRISIHFFSKSYLFSLLCRKNYNFNKICHSIYELFRDSFYSHLLLITSTCKNTFHLQHIIITSQPAITSFTPCSSVSVANFEQENAHWVAGSLLLSFKIVIIIIYNFIFIRSIHDNAKRFPFSFGTSTATELVSTFHKCPISCFS